ncbi:MAG: KTSC domain-containing protein [Kineosporiaceae bacterium]
MIVSVSECGCRWTAPSTASRGRVTRSPAPRSRASASNPPASGASSTSRVFLANLESVKKKAAGRPLPAPIRFLPGDVVAKTSTRDPDPAARSPGPDGRSVVCCARAGHGAGTGGTDSADLLGRRSRRLRRRDQGPRRRVRRGALYRYREVPYEEVDGLLEAGSPGRYLNTRIIPHYACVWLRG